MCRLPSGEFVGSKVNFYIASHSNHVVGRGELNRRRLNGDVFETGCLAGGVLFPSARNGVRERVVAVFVEEVVTRCSVWLFLFVEFCRFAT
jgi:hypothetical protein